MHIQTAYDGHRGFLELLKHFSDAQIITESLSRGGPYHMSSFILTFARAGMYPRRNQRRTRS